MMLSSTRSSIMEKFHCVVISEGGEAWIDSFKTFKEMIQWLIERCLLSETVGNPRTNFTWGEEESVIQEVAKELNSKLIEWASVENPEILKYDYLEAIQRLTNESGFPDKLELIFIFG
jgi:hypothetical protein